MQKNGNFINLGDLKDYFKTIDEAGYNTVFGSRLFAIHELTKDATTKIENPVTRTAIEEGGKKLLQAVRENPDKEMQFIALVYLADGLVQGWYEKGVKGVFHPAMDETNC